MSDAKTAAARAGDHPAVEWGARLGYAASGVLHLLLGYLAVQIAVGSGDDRQASQSGALASLADDPVGQVLLWVIVLGFAMLTLWQLTELVVRTEAFDKAKAGGKVVLYAALAWTTFTFASGGSTSSSQQTSDVTKTLMDAPAGQVLVVALGAGVVAVGGYHLYKGWRQKFLEDLQEHPGRWAVVAGRVGYVGKGVALVAVGVLFVVAALQHQAGRATGLDGGLEALRDLPAGQVVLVAVAIGLASYGAYSFARARYASV